MYDAQTRETALRLLEQGHSPREVSKIMGGKPGHGIIRRWAAGHTPTGKRRSTRLFTVQEKLQAIQRIQAGEDYHEVARELGCEGPTLLTWRRLYTQKGEEALRTRVDDLAR